MGNERALIWVHANTPDVFATMQTVSRRLTYTHEGVSVQFSVPPDAIPHCPTAASIDLSASGAASTFLSNAEPDLAIVVGAQATPSILATCATARIPLALIDPDVSKWKRRSWVWRQTVLRPALRTIQRTFFVGEEEGTTLRSLGFPPYRVERIDPLVESAIPPPFDEQERDAIAQILTSRPVWFIHALPMDELDMIIEAIQVVRRSALRLAIILDLADHSFVEEATAKLKASGLLIQSRAVEGEPDELTQVFMTDIDDETGLWYRLASVCYLGGTFSGANSPNPLIAASLGCAIVHGSQVTQHRTAFGRLRRAQACRRVLSHDKLGAVIAEVLAPDENALLAHAGWDVVSQGAETTDRIVSYIAECLNLEPKGQE